MAAEREEGNNSIRMSRQKDFFLADSLVFITASSARRYE